jgi:hypothetical protein
MLWVRWILHINCIASILGHLPWIWTFAAGIVSSTCRKTLQIN